MALGRYTVWEVQTGGDDANGGGFWPLVASPGTDYSQQAAAQKSGTDLTFGATANKVRPVAAGVSAADVGNIINITAGATFTAGRYIITAQDGTYWTLDRNAGSVSGFTGTYKMGGALKSPAVAAAVKIQGNVVWIKSGTYSITTATVNVAGGCVRDTTGGYSWIYPNRWEGYETTRGDRGARPLLQASGAISTFSLFELNEYYGLVRNIDVDGAGKTASVGFDCEGYGQNFFGDCSAANCTNGGFRTGAASYPNRVEDCSATGCSTIGAFFVNSSKLCNFVRCVAYANTVTGFDITGINSRLRNCVSYGNTGASSCGFRIGWTAVADGCVAYGNGSHGFWLNNGTYEAGAQQCVAYGNADTGFYGQAAIAVPQTAYCASGGNGTDWGSNLWSEEVGRVTLTADPFTAAASGDFSLNTAAGGGAACRQLALVVGASPHYPDIGLQAVAGAATSAAPRFGDMTGGLR